MALRREAQCIDINPLRDFRYGRCLDMCKALDMLCGARGDLYHIEVPVGNYIEFAVRQLYRIAQQYIDNQQKIPNRFRFGIFYASLRRACILSRRVPKLGAIEAVKGGIIGKSAHLAGRSRALPALDHGPRRHEPLDGHIFPQ